MLAGILDASCESWSVSSWRPDGAPPLRDKHQPWGLGGTSPPGWQQLHVGSTLLRVALDLFCDAIADGSIAILEHPSDAFWQPSHVAIWQLEIIEILEMFPAEENVQFHQCTKLLLLRCPSLRYFIANRPGYGVCSHGAHLVSVCRGPDGTFRNTTLKVFPSALCEVIARAVYIGSVAAYDATMESEDPHTDIAELCPRLSTIQQDADCVEPDFADYFLNNSMAFAFSFFTSDLCIVEPRSRHRFIFNAIIENS